MNLVTRFTILILLVSLFMAKMKNKSNDNSRYFILGEYSMDASNFLNEEGDSEGTDFDLYDETIDIDFTSKEYSGTRADSEASTEDEEFKFIINLKCPRETVLCFISNWNDTMDQLVDNEFFKFCFNLDNNTYEIGRDLFLVRNKIIQMSLSDVISYFVIAIMNQETDASIPIDPDMNCENYTISDATIPPDEMATTEIPTTATPGGVDNSSTCKVTNIPPGCKMPCTCTCSPDINCEIESGNENQSTPSLDELIKQIELLKDLLNNFEDDQFDEMANRVQNLHDYLNFILILRNMTTLPNMTGDVRADLEPIIEKVKNLTWILSDNVWNDSCCTQCLQAVEELANSTGTTIKELKRWSITNFQYLMEKLKDINDTVETLIISDGIQSKTIEQLVESEKLLKGNISELRNEFENLRDVLTECCMTLKTKMAELQKNMTEMRNETQQSLEAIHRRINQLAVAVWQIIENIFVDLKELQEDSQLKFNNLTNRVDDLENKFKDDIADLKKKVDELDKTTNDLITNITDLAEKVKDALDLIPRVDQAEKDIEELKKKLDNKVEDRFKELEDLIILINNTLTKVQEEQEAHNKAVNDAQNKRLDDLENSLEKMLNNETCPKECLDKIDELANKIKNITEEQKIANETNDKRLDDLEVKVENNTNNINVLNDKISKCCDNQTAKEEEQKKITDDLEKKLNETIDNLSNLKDECEHNNTILTERIIELEKLLRNNSDAIEKLEECCKKVDDLQKDYTAELEALKEANKSTNIRIDELEKQVKNLTDEQAKQPSESEWLAIIERIIKLEEAVKNCKNCTDDNAKLQKQIDDLTRRVEILEQKVIELNNTIINGSGGDSGSGIDSGSGSDSGEPNGAENECIIAQAEINEDLDERLFTIEMLFNITNKTPTSTTKKKKPKPTKPKKPGKG